MKEILYLFMMFSVVGWLWETPWVSIRTKQYVNRGFLHGPYIPIYGCAVVTIILSMGIFNSVEDTNLLIVLLEMVYMGLITAIWEFTTSWGLEKIFHTRWWDYSSHKYNLQGRISLYVTVFFGLGGYVLWRFVLPPFESLYQLVPANIMMAVLVVFYTIFTIDSIFTLRDLFRVKNIMEILERVSDELANKLDVEIGKVKEVYQGRRTQLDESILHIKNSLQERYEYLGESKTISRVKTELSSIQELITKNRNILRFYRKYPNSVSSQLVSVKRFLEKLPKINRK